MASEYKPRRRDGKLTETSKVALQLLDGKAISTKEAKKHGINNLRAVAGSLEKYGHKFVVTKKARNEVVYQLAGSPEKGEQVAEPADKPVSLPLLGTDVTVTALVMNPDGSYSIGLRNDKSAWLTRLISQT